MPILTPSSLEGPEQMSIVIAIGAGLLSFLSPCVLPMVPIYIGYLSGAARGGRPRDGICPWLYADLYRDLERAVRPHGHPDQD